MYEIIGIQFIDFTANDGNRICGTKLHLVYQSDNVVGRACDNVYISSRVRNGNDFEVGQHCDLLYNKYGKVADVNIIKEV